MNVFFFPISLKSLQLDVLPLDPICQRRVCRCCRPVMCVYLCDSLLSSHIGGFDSTVSTVLQEILWGLFCVQISCGETCLIVFFFLVEHCLMCKKVAQFTGNQLWGQHSKTAVFLSCYSGYVVTYLWRTTQEEHFWKILTVSWNFLTLPHTISPIPKIPGTWKATDKET